MSRHRTPNPVVLPHLFPLFDAARSACRQDRTADRLVTLSLGALWALGRHTLSQSIVALGAGELDWSAWYRLWSVPDRVDVRQLQAQVVREVLTELAPTAPLTVAVDGTHLPRSSARMPGVGWARCPRTPPLEEWDPPDAPLGRPQCAAAALRRG